MNQTFSSVCRHVGDLELPAFSGTRIMMMPVILGDMASVPAMLDGWKSALLNLFSLCPQHHGKVGYLTIDEKTVSAGQTHRREGAHVDGVFKGSCGGWGGGGGGWGSVGNGMLTVSNIVGCRAWNQDFMGQPGYDGECDHMLDQVTPESETIFGAGQVYWVDGLCVHESMPMQEAAERQFVRLSMPSTAPWFEGYTENPLGVKPTGEILGRRAFM